MQLSDRAKQLIPQARIVSFTPWKDLYSEEVIAIFQAADDQGRYLSDQDLDMMKKLAPDTASSGEQSRLLREQASDLVAEAREQLLVHFPNITDPGNDLYPKERAEACWRDFWHFLRCITYGITGKNVEFTSQEGLKNMELLYQELRVPLPAMIYGLEQLKIVSLRRLNEAEQDVLELYFDHLITALKQFS